jgi:predicted GIY-YIG superfamily endonuclease
LAQERDTARYTLRDGHKIVYIGITNKPERREGEHQQDKRFDQMRVEGPKVCRDTALDWEQQALDRFRRGHQGKNPKYNE